MADEFKEMDLSAPAAPVLTFDAKPQEVVDAPVPVAPDGTGAAMMGAYTKGVSQEEMSLTPEEKEQVKNFAATIDLSNTQGIMNYGAGTQKKMADFSEKAIGNVRSKDMGEVGNMISTLVAELKSFDIDENDKGLKGLFKKAGNKFQAMKARYSKVETNVNEISKELERHQVTLLKDIDILDKMYDLNLAYFKELTMYILAGKQRLEEVRNGQLKELQAKADASGLLEDAQAAKDLAAQCERFEKKIYDLELTRTIAMQTAPQIRMVQTSDSMMAEKIQSTIVNTIPLWKNQMVIAIGIEHSTQASKAEREVNDMTNALLRKNADQLKMATIDAAKESERGIVDIETLKHTNETLITTLDEVLKIQTEGKEKRKAAETELGQIEYQLKAKLMEAAKK